MTSSLGPREAPTQASPSSADGRGQNSSGGGQQSGPRRSPVQLDPNTAPQRPGAGESAAASAAEPTKAFERRPARGSGADGGAGNGRGPGGGANVTSKQAAPAPKSNQPQVNRVRRARLRAVRADPWSVMKTAFLLSIAFAIVTLVAVTIVWQVLDASGVYDSINRTIGDVLGSQNQSERFDIQDFIGLRRVLGIATLVSVVNVVLITAIATLGAFLYNLSASLLGGVELTLAEDE